MNSLNSKKDEYIAKIIHDIENPIIAQINALQSFLVTAESKISQDEKDLIELTLNSCNYLIKTVETFNFAYKLNSEMLTMNFEKFNFSELIKDSIKELSILLKYYELNLKLNFGDEIIINADKFYLKKVVENLLSNSINYAYKNSTIEINIQKIKEKILFEIKNNSPFLEPATLKNVFDKHKTNVLYNKNVVGLGLYLSKEIINAHNGEMIIKSFYNDVNIFGFELPLEV